MSVRASSKYPLSSSRTSSASRPSERVVKPTRSAKSTDTSRRSAVGAAGARAGSAVAARGVPHSPQKRWPGGFAAPQAEHVAVSSVPHSPQNFCADGFSVPQLEHVTTLVSLVRAGHANKPRKGLEHLRHAFLVRAWADEVGDCEHALVRTFHR